ncbi:MAG: TonB-dependent receptor [Saprospiraceae bacterium]|nr:TonB-dependent receptor [Saprospiraceae bacterium]
MNKRLCPFVMSIALGGLLTAQADCTFTLKGRIIDTEKHAVAFANIYVKELSQGVVADESGFFTIKNLCHQTYTLDMSHVECNHKTQQVHIDGNTEGVFELQHDVKVLQNVIIQSKRVQLTETQAHTQISGSDLEQKQGQNLGEMLRSIAGVSSLNVGSTISKPVVQGLHSDRVLILNNGVRQEGQQWGLDHAPEIDPFIADRISVVKGASAVKYGVGAIGGVILVEPRALRDTIGLGGEVNIQGASNGRMGILSSFLEGRNSLLGWRVQGTFKRGGNLMTPQYFLSNTGVLEANGSVMLDFRVKNVKNEVFFSHFYTEIGIFQDSHIGNTQDLLNAIARGKPAKDAEFTYTIARPAQRVQHDILKWKASIPTGDIGRLTLQAAGQYNHRKEYDFHRPNGRKYLTFDTVQIAFQMPSAQLRADWEHRPFKNWHGGLGTEGFYQLNNTYAGGLIPDFQQATAGIYWTERWRRYPSPFELEGGVRYDYRQLWVDSTRYGQQNKQFVYANISASVGAIYHIQKWGKLSFNLGTAWRSPNVNELFSDGVHHGNASFETGDPTLVPERALNGTLSLSIKTAHFEAEANVYQNHIQHFIYLSPDSVPRVTIRGVFPAFTYRQTDALLRGGDWTAKLKLTGGLWWTNAVSILFAHDQTNDSWLPLMPANRIEQGLKYEAESFKSLKNPFISTNIVVVSKQKHVPTKQNSDGTWSAQDYAEPPDGYVRVDAYAGFETHLGKLDAHFGLRITNLLNTQYRDYTDRFRYFADAQGRNISLSAKLIF